MTEADTQMVDDFAAKLVAIKMSNPVTMSLSKASLALYRIKEFLHLRFHGDRFMPVLRQRAACDDLEASLNAIVSLSVIGNSIPSRKEECISALCACLDYAQPLVIGMAVQCLHSLDALGISAVREATARLLNSSDPIVQRRTATTLAEAKDSRAVPILLDQLRDADSDVREQARAALTKYRGRGFLFGSASPKKWQKWWEKNRNS